MATKTYVAWLNVGYNSETVECEFELDADLSENEVEEQALENVNELIAEYVDSGWCLKSELEE